MNHWDTFAAFCAKELRTGPDPQIDTLARIAKDKSLAQRAWLIGCYGAHHCVPSAVAVWQSWTPHDAAQYPGQFTAWLMHYWKYLPVRNEMRSHRMVVKRAACLIQFAQLAIEYRPSMWETYDEAWIDSQKRVKFFGRYMAIKVLEMFRRFGSSPHLVLPDMRAKGGWSPRRTLGLLWKYPDDSNFLSRSDNSPATIAKVERVFASTRRVLRERGIRVSAFQLQVLLCEYREALHGSYYPGASLDEELHFVTIVAQAFPKARDAVFRARYKTFAPKYLGELHDWNDTRPELYLPFKVASTHR